MKKVFILAALLAWGGLASPAGAEVEEMYLTPKIGLSIFTGENGWDSSRRSSEGHDAKRSQDTGFALGLAAGYNFAHRGAPVRAELEYTYRTPFETEGGTGSYNFATYRTWQKATIQTLMFNGYYDIETDTIFTPYVGAGLGLAFVKGKSRITFEGGSSSEASSNISRFAWSLTGGAAWEVDEGLTMDLGYRYFNFNDLTLGIHSGDVGNIPGDRGYAGKAKNHEIMLGLRFSFDSM